MCEYLGCSFGSAPESSGTQRKAPPPSILYASLFTSFDKDFKAYEQELERWAVLINRRVAVQTTKSSRRSQSILLRASRSASKRQDEERRQRLLHELSPHETKFGLIWRNESGKRKREMDICECDVRRVACEPELGGIVSIREYWQRQDGPDGQPCGGTTHHQRF